MSKEEQSVYLASLKEYRDWYAVLETAENKGYEKAIEKLEKIQKEKDKIQKEKDKVQKEKDKILKASISKFIAMNLSISEIAGILGVSEELVKDLNK
jgi:hypothetical protein